jgi:heptose I phosphotransferase
MAARLTDHFHAKQGRSIGRWVLQAGDRRLAVYLKRHHRLSWWRGLLAVLWPRAGWSPAWQECCRLRWARRQGLSVPVPAAVGEYIGPWGRLQSFLAVEELEDMLPLHTAIPAAAGQLEAGAFQRWKRGLIAELARVIRALHARRWFHKDLYLCHFYLRAEDIAGGFPDPNCEVPEFHGRLHVIDLHRLAHHPWTGRFWQVKDLAQLLYSSELSGVTDRDRLRFSRAYLGRDRRTWTSRWLRLAIRFKAWRYRKHNARRQQ